MALEVWREYLGEMQLVGHFNDAPRFQRLFAYDPGYLERDRAHALSPALPLRPKPFDVGEFGPFFEGMVPEGAVRVLLSQRFQIAQPDYLSLLERLGEECVGALVFRSIGEDGVPVEFSKPSYGPFDEDDLAFLEGDDAVFGSKSMQESRLSLAGAQSKTGLYLPKGRDASKAGIGDWMYPVGMAPSTHIVKVSSRFKEALAVNEFICLNAAGRCGLEVAGTYVSSVLPRTLVSKRYDRIWPETPRLISGIEAPWRLHQVDFCQMLSLPSYAKYETRADARYSRSCGELIRRESANAIADVRAFALQAAIDYALGNCDSHLKNHSFLYSPTWDGKRLSPAYDIVCTTVLGYDRRLGMGIGEHRRIDDVTAADFSIFAHDVGMPERRFKKDVALAVDVLAQALPEFASASGTLGEVATAMWEDMQARLAILRVYAGK